MSVYTGDRCLVSRSNPNEVIQLVKGQRIRLNGHDVKGYEAVEEEEQEEIMTINGKKYKLIKE